MDLCQRIKQVPKSMQVTDKAQGIYQHMKLAHRYNEILEQVQQEKGKNRTFMEQTGHRVNTLAGYFRLLFHRSSGKRARGKI